MKIGDLLAPGHVVPDLRVPDKRRLLEALARRVAVEAGIGFAAIVEALNAREGLGSTGIGAGVALPHARLPSLAQPLGAFARLRTPVAFDAIDGAPVDLVFLVLLPAKTPHDPLGALAAVARRLRAEPVRAALRRSPDAEGLYAILTDPAGP